MLAAGSQCSFIVIEWHFDTREIKKKMTETISRKEAKCRGLKRYFTGKPCQHGHVCERTTSNSACVLCQREDHQRNREKRLAKMRAAYWADPTKRRQQARAWHRAHPEKAKRARLEWSRKNRQKSNSIKYEWRKRNREKARIIASNCFHRRKIRQKSAGAARYSVTEIKNTVSVQQNKCYWCLCELTDGYHIDHFIPIVSGGSNSIENIVISCPKCNRSKGAKMPWEFCDLPFARLAPLEASVAHDS